MRVSKSEISRVHRIIFDWWKDNRRDLPWRETHDPYKILVSEIMLQQTQVSRALPKYQEFLANFPDIGALAHARTSEVLKVWKGMGYNRRALYLKKTAEAVVDTYQGIFPKTEEVLRTLPGLGRYTARAILVFAYKYDVAMVDTNIRQIIVHFFFGGKPQKEKVIEDIADQLVPPGLSWEWHQALMDYGALELSKLKRSTPRKKPTKKTVAFRDSKRFIRGKVLDELRTTSIDERALIEQFVKLYGKTEYYLQSILADLYSEGLIAKKGMMVSLPD